MSIWDNSRYFEASEFGDHAAKMNPALIERLNYARSISGVPYHISSHYRSDDPGAHGDGDAVDIKCASSGERFSILLGLVAAGFTRIGIYDKHCHADVSESRDQKVIWIGKSQ